MNSNKSAMSTGEFASHLAQFTGTENWYRHHLIRDVTYTDGVKYFADNAAAWWFVDDAIIEYDPLMTKHGFIVITLAVRNSQAVIKVDDGNDKMLKSKIIEYTDCPDGTYKFYFTDNVLMLPSEY
jgi:hypothetical protein